MDLPEPILAASPWFVLLVVAVIAFVVIVAFRPKHDFSIIVGQDDVEIRGAVAKRRRHELVQFFQNDLQLEEALTVLGRRGPGGRLQLQFRGPIDPGTRQRIRNFLLTVL